MIGLMVVLGMLSVVFLLLSAVAGSVLFFAIAGLLYAGEWALYFVAKRQGV